MWIVGPLPLVGIHGTPHTRSEMVGLLTQPHQAPTHPKKGIARTPLCVTRFPIAWSSCVVDFDISVGDHELRSSLSRSAGCSSHHTLLLLEKKVTTSLPWAAILPA